MNINRVIFATAAIVSLAACSISGRSADELRFFYVAHYSINGQKKSASTGALVEPYQRHMLMTAGGSSGWAGLGCTVTGNAIPIPVKDGTIYVMLPEHGYTMGRRMCDIAHKFLNVPYADNEGAWVEKWNKATRSRYSINLLGEFFPGLLFVPAGKDVRSASILEEDDLKHHGVSNLGVYIEVNKDAKIVVPKEVKDAIDIPDWEGESWKNPDKFSYKLHVVRSIS
jgi:hypothetical protein